MTWEDWVSLAAFAVVAEERTDWRPAFALASRSRRTWWRYP
jgi:hypothetical protein